MSRLSCPRLLLPVVAGIVLVACGVLARRGPALADEFIYLAGARHLTNAGSLDARFYDGRALLNQGYPHQDNHSPGYVLLLAGTMCLLGGGYLTAVGLNIAAYLSAAVLLWRLCIHLGVASRESCIAVALLLVFPAFAPYVYWVMAEVVLVTFFLATLGMAAGAGRRPGGAMLTGLLFGLCFLLRESALFGVPAVLALLPGRRAVLIFLITALCFAVLVYAPLSAGRSAGASNFWAPTYGKEFGFEVVRSLKGGKPLMAVRLAWDRAALNLRELRSNATTLTERGILIALALLPFWSLLAWPQLTSRQRRFLLGLVLGWLAMAGVIVGIYVVARWAGFRYLLFLGPPFLPFAARPVLARGRAPGWVFPAALAVAFVALNVQILGILDRYKISRQKRQEGIAAYVERYMDTRQITRVVLPNGWLFGLRHYPTEVISSLPDGPQQLRELERSLWFDYVVLPGESPLGPEWDGRIRYRRLNADDPQPPLLVYRRLK